MPKAFLNNIFIKFPFPLKKLILVGIFPCLGYILVTGISQAFKPIWVALVDRYASSSYVTKISLRGWTLLFSKYFAEYALYAFVVSVK